MASWAEFEAAEPDFARRVRALLTSRKHLTMATLRRSGAPRISGTEVQLVDGELRIGSMTGAVKALDLRRDARVAIHGPTHDPTRTGRWRGEAKVAGRAVEVDSGDSSHAFRIDLDEVVITHLNGERDKLVVESWNTRRGYRKVERD
ncbi:MAG TPA: pyridoxamine 5'-phosphate oxidase family protein [Candidatus Dormibacteraeota bacterium]|nr:pyridoxamine 5'-phosphate oxidase family protein [Candidatus Dormibacteraeota bacterium]